MPILSGDSTLYRYAFEQTVGHIPHIGQWLIRLSDRQLALLNLAFGIAALWTGVMLWTSKQAEIGGRSWRSRVSTITRYPRCQGEND